MCGPLMYINSLCALRPGRLHVHLSQYYITFRHGNAKSRKSFKSAIGQNTCPLWYYYTVTAASKLKTIQIQEKEISFYFTLLYFYLYTYSGGLPKDAVSKSWHCIGTSCLPLEISMNACKTGSRIQ